MKKFTKKEYLVFCCSISIVIYALWMNQDIQAKNQIYFPRPLSDSDIKMYSNHDLKAVVIYPILTQFAYKDGGFYDYFKGVCSTCTTITMQPFGINATYTTGLNGFETLMQLHYPFITDLMVDKHPEILNEYDKIILLHNEYMTINEFNAIKNHKNVFYLYPNSMYAQVSVNYDKLTMTLVRGHGYPQKSLANGFDYITDTKHEYDLKCQNYKWEAMPNGITPTCWPEFLLKSDRSILGVIRDFPDTLPPLVSLPNQPLNMSKMCYFDQNGHCTLKFGG